MRGSIVLVVLAACSSKPKPGPVKPKPAKAADTAVVESAAEREASWLEKAHAIVPKGATCLPAALHEKSAPRLELAAIGSDAVLCAYDTEPTRLLGPVACWQIDLTSGGLVYRDPAPLPGIGFAMRMEERCARDFCIDDEPADKIAHLAYSPDGSKVAMLAGDQVSLFDAENHAREGGFSIKGVGRVARLHLNETTVFVEAGEASKQRVYMFGIDGTRLGAISDTRNQSMMGGSFSLLDRTRAAIAEPGWTALIVIDTATGKKTRLVRTLPRSPCTADETAAYWGGEDVSETCNTYMVKTFDHLIGATAVAGTRNLLVVLRNGRLGELAVLDASNLVEKQAINLPWCEPEEEVTLIDDAD